MTRIAAVILAGGRGERLGGINKALLKIGSRRLVDHAIAAASDCDPILLAVGAGDLSVAGTRAIPDLETDYAGPLAGVVAAIDALAVTDAELLLSLAVDTPFFPHDFLTRALPLLADADAVIATYAAQDYPTNAVWRLAPLRDLPRQLRDGSATRSLKRLAANLRATRLDYSPLASEDPFANANTPEDLAMLQARAAVERYSR